MKTSKTIFSLLFLVMIPGGCIVSYTDSITGDGNVVQEIRNLSDFNGIKVSSGIDVYLTQGQNTEVIVEADQNLHEWIITEVSNSVLHINSEKNIRMAESKVVYVTCPVIQSIDISSAGDITGENLIRTEQMNIDMSSAGDLRLELEAGEIAIDISSAGNAYLKGTVKNLYADLSSAGDLDAYDLVAESADVSVSSAGNANVHITGEAKFRSSSAGDINYMGDPKIIEMHSSSAGSINKK
ncbi:MAG: DUF2807 domain-containing protein [Bacteroidales bacterium]|nr:DUF2807 domain-containing protein [Bacteroidales bacterium]